ncbi:MAG: ferrochelatase [Legionellales bacterium RIFCSPHIGHO2_12_FULL_35_11]|nr:MAG: ferrochelatase [Legionellales bacterium RIFCSPHIGHO2_12_FULL_35_11]
MNKGLLLINLGTPEKYDLKSVRKYLKEFLSDKRVIDVPSIIRYLLLYGAILPFRAPKVAKSYKKIWTNNGSPLRSNSEQLLIEVRNKIDKSYKVAFGMRYGTPSIKDALKYLERCDEIIILPLYPQYSSAATGSSIEYTLKIIQQQEIIPSLKIIRDFFNNEDYINSEAALIKPYVENHDYIIFSYHGIPERQIIKSGCKFICHEACPSKNNTKNSTSCYRAQCFKTTELIAKSLNLQKANYTTSFQSRLGKNKWIEPYTDEVLTKLANQGVENLAIVCPSFIADCLETIEEIGMQASLVWRNLTGQKLTLIPCLNFNDGLVNTILNLASASPRAH